MIIFLTKD